MFGERDRLHVYGIVEISDKRGNVLFVGKNRITYRGLEVLARSIIQDGTLLSHVELGSGAGDTLPDMEGLASPIPLRFEIINRSVNLQPGKATIRLVSMIESEDPSMSFSFSEAGLFGEVPPQGPEGEVTKVMVARITFPTKHKKPYNEYYLTWNINLSL